LFLKLRIIIFARLKRFVLAAFVLAAFSCAAYSAGGKPIALEKISVNPHDKSAVLRGAKFYAKNCMVCHTMRYLRYNAIAKRAGITLDKMPLKQKEWWLDIVPPDLTLLARQRSANWIYTYLHSFYKDDTRPTGYNNLLVKEINMPNLFALTQGVQVLTKRGKELLQGANYSMPHYYNVLELIHAGSQTPAQFDQDTLDLVTFFVYAADPGHTFRIHLGVWVILFLVIFLILTIFLKRNYWKDIEKSKRRKR